MLMMYPERAVSSERAQRTKCDVTRDFALVASAETGHRELDSARTIRWKIRLSFGLLVDQSVVICLPFISYIAPLHLKDHKSYASRLNQLHLLLTRSDLCRGSLKICLPTRLSWITISFARSLACNSAALSQSSAPL